MATRSNSQFLAASVTEFVTVWALGGNASLNLSTSGGITTVGFNCTLGHPSAPHILPPPQSLPSPPPPPKPRHRGPAERERNRLRAARHQASKGITAGSAPFTSVLDTVSVAASSPSTEISTNPTIIVPVIPSHPQQLSVTPLNTALASSSAPGLEMSSPSAVSNPLSCDLCDFEGVSTVGLKIHKSRKHEDIPQIDGECLDTRETDCWWEKHQHHSLRTYQVYLDVLMDIENAPLTKEEKFTEIETVTNVRKNQLGKIYMDCPPWNRM